MACKDCRDVGDAQPTGRTAMPAPAGTVAVGAPVSGDVMPEAQALRIASRAADPCAEGRRFRTRRRRSAGPVPEFRPLDQPTPQGRDLNTGYYKTTVSRVMRRAFQMTSTTQVYRQWLTLEQMARTATSDARSGLFFVEMRSVLAGDVTSQFRVIWEVPGGPWTWQLSTTTLSGNTVYRIPAWEGPTPGRVGIELELMSPAPVKGYFTVDLCAKRLGGNFMRGMWLNDVSRERRVPRTLKALPRPGEGPEPPRARAIRRRPCGLASPSAIGARSSARRMPVPSAPDGEPWETDIPDKVMPETGESRQMKEARAAVQRLLSQATASGSLSLNLGGISMNFPGAIGPYVGQHGLKLSDLPRLVGDAAGFEEAWEKVTHVDRYGESLERRRYPINRLDDILVSGDATGSVEVDTVGTIAWSDDRSSDTAWTWRTEAPWFTHERTWFAVSLINLLHGTFELVENSIRTPTKKKDNVIYKGRARERMRIGKNPNWYLDLEATAAYLNHTAWTYVTANYNVASGEWEPEQNSPVQDVAEFSVETLTWDWSGVVQGDDPVRDEGTRGQCGANSGDGPPERIWLMGWFVAPYVRPAADLYALARLITMTRAAFEDALPHGLSSLLSRAASAAWRGHLAMLAPVTKTLLHEMFHLGNASFWEALGLVEDHCVTGCGQEKMGVHWLHDVSTMLELPWVRGWASRSPGPSEIRYPDSSAPNTLTGQSTCYEDGGEYLHVQWEIERYGLPDSVLTVHLDDEEFDHAGELAQEKRRIEDWLHDKRRRLRCKISKLETKRQCKLERDKSNSAENIRDKERNEAERIRKLEWKAEKKLYKARIRTLETHAQKHFVKKCWMPYDKPPDEPRAPRIVHMLDEEIGNSVRKDWDCQKKCEGDKKPYDRDKVDT